MYVSLTLVALAEGNHSVRFDRLIGEDLEPFLSEKKIFSSLIRIKSVNGRLELVRTFPDDIKVYVDFAHTPDALSKSIKSLKWSGKYSIIFWGLMINPKKTGIDAIPINSTKVASKIKINKKNK